MQSITITDLRNGKQDVDHIAAIATSTAPTATDRLGATKQTMKGILDDLNATAAITATGMNRAAAEAAAALATTARDAAIASADIYATTAAGIAATTTGKYFSVPSVDSNEYLILYLNSAGTAVEKKRYPSAAAIAAIMGKIFSSLAPGYAAAFVDGRGKIAAGILDDGSFKIAELQALAAIGGDYSPETLTIGGVKFSLQEIPGYILALVDPDGRIAIGVKTSGEFVCGKITALEASLPGGLGGGTVPTMAEIGAYFGLPNYTTTNAYALGDSTVANNGVNQPAILSLLASGRIKNYLAVPGHTIAQQKTVWVGTTVVAADVGWVIVQIGLNDLAPAEAASVAIARLQDLINTVRATIGPTKTLLISQMIPCRQRLINIYGAVDGVTSQQKWVDMNAAIAGTGPTPITGVDGRITSHVALMGDGAGNLKSIYDTGDAIHPNTAGRTVNAAAWLSGLRSINVGLVA